jgi:hypothetical protein
MNAAAVIESLRHPRHEIPRDALAEVVSHPDAFVPILIAAIESVTLLGIDADLDDCLAPFACYLLAELREPSALQPILAYFACAVDDDAEDEFFGDILTQDGARILAAIGDPATLRQYADRPDLGLATRNTALHALVLQVLWGEQPRAPLVEYFTEILDTHCFGSDFRAWTSFVFCCLDLHPREFLEPIRELIRRGLIDPIACDDEELTKEAAEDPAEHRRRVAAIGYNKPITDTATDVAWWADFAPPEDLDWEDAGAPGYDLPGIPIRREQPKIGRNDLCPCGSGKKYKKCCGSTS